MPTAPGGDRVIKKFQCDGMILPTPKMASSTRSRGFQYLLTYVGRGLLWIYCTEGWLPSWRKRN